MNIKRFSTNGNSNGNANGRITYDTKARKRALKAKTPNQQAYMDAIESRDIIFCLGPAGTGKSCVAAGMAARLFLADEVSRIKVVRPTIEVGGTLGFLPGDLDDKVHPYLRPILEEMEYFLGRDELKKLRAGESPSVEMCPLQLLRGCNFKEAIVILDEAQNATYKQLDMFLKRLSYGSKLIINGDPSQSDLPLSEQGALIHFSSLYADFDEVAVVHMTRRDCVRHPLVEKMLARDEAYNDNRIGRGTASSGS